ncbi:achaete-scute complex protein T4 [Eurytemora carolleeae]|uniref:achaete-scute complex protein T4 n=1 Tax=Eurytemora carolleeae TaxID=1294199 RepID=UPI000C756B24|nr:achaete-scute complex protein T4 [Eurytemora carolleeae]|eukprot:XP_023346148.1 achaete-scute complex protein T4-like [Eurytemora affinis]
MSLRTHVPGSPLKTLQLNNGQINPSINQSITLKDIKVTAKADSTGIENNVQRNVFIKHHHSVKKMQTPTVARRNARERNRVKVVNSGFDVLKHHVPHLKSKVSKVETLKAAVDYIRALKEMLGEEDDFVPSGPILIGDNESLDDDASNFSELADSSFSPSNSLTSSTDIQDVTLHPMVYQLPPSSSILYSSPSSIPSISSPLYQSSMVSSPNTEKISSSFLIPPEYQKEGETIRLPSIAAPSWWPQMPTSSDNKE